jgi:mRNA interferase RelE/StbE
MAVAQFTILYHPAIRSDIDKLGNTEKQLIQRAIEKKLTTTPEIFGIPLRKSLKGYRKLRVGDFRVVFRLDDQTVKIFTIQHRSVVYQNLEKRIGL